ncbi:alkylhydroperoxidase domain protein [Pantoea phytobeneficialis]|uniref:Alkylhydroperoxidase domain protein n=1 Tax=Pantoea phytobeneficialis TaxID=2052056 RepID=A0AAP9H9J0_9GAMM|nr:alkylhydroperoxidase domain protein [Pantoea phytobeneficialis]MDO6406678.1 alkylhydroperoxidase domain protein [Pantoea phytobeneficialis]QGR09210.1 alkylhydroperoxidase domain protein [Pantoea phytobeneficialis]
MSQVNDLLAALADIDPASELAQARAQRDAATRHTQGSYEVLFGQHDDDFPLPARFALAAQVAAWHGEVTLQAHYQQQASGAQHSARDEAARAFAERLSFRPVEATPQHIANLHSAGWTPRGIVTLAQLVAFVSFQSRLLAGFRLLNGDSLASTQHAVAGIWHNAPRTHSGKTALTAFTQQELGWEPWLAAKPLHEFTTEEKATLARFGHSDSDYFRLLGRNLPLLEQRTLTDKGIFYTSGGLARAERELAATVVSKVNGCIYCASVHARKASQLAKDDAAVQKLLNVSPGAELSHGQSPRWQAIIDFSAALSVTPASASQAQLQALRAQGLDTLQLLDLVQSTAFFAWANRLMLTLGEPFLPADAQG